MWALCPSDAVQGLVQGLEPSSAEDTQQGGPAAHRDPAHSSLF